MIGWLQGLVTDIAFTKYDILSLAFTWGMLPLEATEEEEQNILGEYWNLMSRKFLQLFDGYHVPKV